jgi:hypothetical protein
LATSDRRRSAAWRTAAAAVVQWAKKLEGIGFILGQRCAIDGDEGRANAAPATGVVDVADEETVGARLACPVVVRSLDVRIRALIWRDHRAIDSRIDSRGSAIDADAGVFRRTALDRGAGVRRASLVAGGTSTQEEGAE